MKPLRISAPWLLALVVASPLAAQQAVPLDIVPLTPVQSAPVGSEAIVEEPDPAAAETMAAAAGAEADVEVGVLQAPDPEAIGLMEESEGGFPYDMWRGSDRALIERLLPRLPAGATSRAMNGLTRRLLLTTAAPPVGPAEGSLLAIRIERLAR